MSPRDRENVSPPKADTTITITQKNTMTTADFKKRLSWAAEVTVQWINESRTPRIITFVTGWPFYGLQHTIYVPERGVSDVFKVDSHKPRNTIYDYTVSPQVQGPPDGPAVIVNS